MAIREFIESVNPFKKVDNNSNRQFIIQKILAFILIYIISAVVMEGLIILLFTVLGYNILQQEMPPGIWVEYLPLYGFIGFGIITLLYVRFVEKRKLEDLYIHLNLKSLGVFLINFAFGAVLLGLILFVLVLSGQFEFTGFGTVNWQLIFIALGAFLIQGSTEELMTRGFLQTSLSTRTRTWTAILVSAVMFMLPHLLSNFEMQGLTAIVSIINLLLISVLFSLAMLKSKSLAAAAGIHVAWNFFLSNVFGLQLSGSESSQGIVNLTPISNNTLITGGEYGIEASIILVPILIVVNLIYFYALRSEGQANEVQQ